MRMPNRRPQLELIAPSASPAEAAAIVAALERFMRDTAPRMAPPAQAVDPVAARGYARRRSANGSRRRAGPLDKYLKAARL